MLVTTILLVRWNFITQDRRRRAYLLENPSNLCKTSDSSYLLMDGKGSDVIIQNGEMHVGNGDA